MLTHRRVLWQATLFLVFLAASSGNCFSQALSLCQALDNCGLTWSNKGDAPWVAEKGVAFLGDSAAASGGIGNNQSSMLETSVTGPGAVSFYWKVSSENFADFLIFYIDGVEVGKVSGEADWQQKIFNVDTGSHLLGWAYVKDKSGSWGSDMAWLDKIEYVAVPLVDNPPLASVTSPSNGATLSGIVTIQATATDDYGVSKIELYVDAAKVAECASAPCSYNWDTLNSSNDTHLIKAIAYDTGNQTGQGLVTVRVYNLGSLPSQERDALVTLYGNTGGANWNIRSNWLKGAGTECSWYGVTCNASNTHVIGIDLYGNSLVNSLPAQLANLTGLQSLNLSGNYLNGNIPAEFGTLSNLNTLKLAHNQLSGSIPPELGSLANLMVLDLTDNRLTGNIPLQLGGLMNLVDLQLGQNQLSAGIPAQLGNLLRLQSLMLNDNQLYGSIPIELANLRNLRQLSLAANQLSGEIPAQLGNLSNLTSLRLYKNQLSGVLPYQLGNLSKLQVLELYSNQLVSNIPSSLSNLSGLQWLHLEENQLGGDIPSQLGNLANLTSLRLSNNRLSGNIPAEFGKLTKLTVLQLSNNNLTGSVPAALGSLVDLSDLELHQNHLSGPIPDTLGNLVKLVRLYLSGNQLSGSIPAIIGNLASLESLNLSSNQLSGPIPLEIGRLTSLGTLQLQSNQLDSEIPQEFTSLSKLQYLDLRWNALFSTNAPVLTFLAKVQPSWQDTQTVSPFNVKAASLSNSSIQVTWTPILYTADGGGYRVLYSVNHLGPYSVYGTTPDKTAVSLTLTGLPYSATPYFIVVQSVTNAHRNNQNQVVSNYSLEVFASTLIQDNPPVASVTAPANGAVVTGAVVIQASASDDQGVSKVEFYVDGHKVGESVAAPYSATWDASNYSNTFHTIEAKAYDTAGQSTASQVTVTVSNPAGSLNTWLLPSSARIVGAMGGLWSTDVSIANVGASDASFTLRFVANGTDGQLAPEAPFTLKAGNTLVLKDVLGSVFGVNSGFGSIFLNSTSLDLLMLGQTSIPGGSGTFGQSVPAFAMNEWADPSMPASISAVREDPAFRTNLVLANASEVPVQVDATLVADSGLALATKSYSLLPLGMTQVNRVVRDMGISSSLVGARLIVSTATGGGKFAVYASVIDNATNDPRTLLPQTGGAVLLPSSAHISSVGGGTWTTDLTASNTGPADASFTLKFLGNGVDGRSGPEVSLVLAAGKSATYVDVLHSVFGLSSGFGAIQLKSSSSATLALLGQTSIAGSGGTYGQSVPAATPADLIMNGIAKSVLGISEDQQFRTNLVLANATEATLKVDVQLVSLEGVLLGSKQYALAPLAMIQVNRVVRDLAVSSAVSGARLVLSTSTPGGSFAAYGTVIDNFTNDPRTLLPR